MQFQTIVAASLAVAVASAATNTTVPHKNGTNTTSAPTHAETSNGASGLLINTGIVGALVAGGVALML